MWTDETRIQKSHKGWSLCGVQVNVAAGIFRWKKKFNSMVVTEVKLSLVMRIDTLEL